MKKTKLFPRANIIRRQLTRAEAKLATGGDPSATGLENSAGHGRSPHHEPQIIALYGVVIATDTV
jgi:hypothetical protein